MSKRIRINNDIQVDWIVNVEDSEEHIADLSSFDLALDLIVGTKVFNVTNFTISGNLITFIYRGADQIYTGSYVMKLYDATNTSITYDIKSAFVLVDHSWCTPDVITVPTEVEITSTVSVSQIIGGVIGPKGDKGDKGDKGEKGEPGDGSTPASESSVGGIKLGYQQNNKNYPVQLDTQSRAFVNVPWDGGGGGGGGDVGRSVTSIDYWFKLSSYDSGITTPSMNIVDPGSSAGGNWSLVAANPTRQLPYLWTFSQVNYDKELDSGYTYSRTSAYCVRRYNTDASQEFDELEDMINQLRSDLESQISDYDEDLRNLSDMMNNLREEIELNITSDIQHLNERFASIDASDVKKIEDNQDGLWGVLTSYNDDTRGQKSFSDIVLDAKNAKQTLYVGSQFFGNRTGAEITLDGLKGQIAMKATQDDIDSAIAQAQFSVDPAALKSIISKGQKCWKKGDILYPYDLYLLGYSGTIEEYEAYMALSPEHGGPQGDGTPEHPAGPFNLVVTVNQFSNIQQEIDNISTSVYEVKYAWEKDGNVYDYNNFRTQYDERPSTYEDYTYEEYVSLVLRYQKVEVGSVLSGIIQTSSELESIIGDMGYAWKKERPDGKYDYQRYAVPSNMTRSEYIDYMEDRGWELFDFSQSMTVIDQTQDSITFGVRKASLVWVDDSKPATSDAYCRDYDYWYDSYEQSSYSGSYEDYVSDYHSAYQLTKVSDSISRIKQTDSSISSIVTSVDALGDRVSSVEQTADGISAMAMKGGKVWKKTISGEENTQAYDFFVSEWQESGSSLAYETWVTSVKGYVLEDIVAELGAVKVKSDKVFAGVTDSNGNVAAAISIMKDIDTDQGKIVLDANKVIINGSLAVSDRIDTGNADVGTEIYAGLFNIKKNGITRARFGVDERGDIVLQFLDATGTRVLYEFGPTGITSHVSSSAPSYTPVVMAAMSSDVSVIPDNSDGSPWSYPDSNAFNTYYVFNDGKVTVGGVTTYYVSNQSEALTQHSEYHGKVFVNGGGSPISNTIISDGMYLPHTSAYTSPALYDSTNKKIVYDKRTGPVRTPEYGWWFFYGSIRNYEDGHIKNVGTEFAFRRTNASSEVSLGPNEPLGLSVLTRVHDLSNIENEATNYNP